MMQPSDIPSTGRNDLVVDSLSLVRSFVFAKAKRLPRHVDVDDLLAAGHEGLVKAAADFDPAVSANFEPYAYARIRGHVLDELRSSDRLTRYGRNLVSQAESGRALSERKGSWSIATLVGGSSYHADVMDVAVASLAVSPIEAACANETRRALAAALLTLSKRDRRLVELYFFKDNTQAEIGKTLGVTESRVCQRLSGIIIKLRKAMENANNSTVTSSGSASEEGAPPKASRLASVPSIQPAAPPKEQLRARKPTAFDLRAYVLRVGIRQAQANLKSAIADIQRELSKIR